MASGMSACSTTRTGKHESSPPAPPSSSSSSFSLLRVVSYKVTNGGRGYEAGHPPAVKIEAPPYLTDTARATTTLRRSGSVFRVALRSSGKGYQTAPTVTISPPRLGIITNPGEVQHIDSVRPSFRWCLLCSSVVFAVVDCSGVTPGAGAACLFIFCCFWWVGCIGFRVAFTPGWDVGEMVMIDYSCWHCSSVDYLNVMTC